jgi:hypothetical protein
MQNYLITLIFFTMLPAWSCLHPSTKELQVFFEGSRFWSEVRDANSRQLEPRNPVFLLVSFTDPKGTRIRWGDQVISGSDLSLCWRDDKKKKIVIRKNFFTTTLIKVKEGLLKSYIPFEGDLFYRKDSEVQRPSSDRGLAEDREPKL